MTELTLADEQGQSYSLVMYLSAVSPKLDALDDISESGSDIDLIDLLNLRVTEPPRQRPIAITAVGNDTRRNTWQHEASISARKRRRMCSGHADDTTSSHTPKGTRNSEEDYRYSINVKDEVDDYNDERCRFRGCRCSKAQGVTT